MPRAIVLARTAARTVALSARIDRIEWLRALLVSTCALALIAAGRMLPF